MLEVWLIYCCMLSVWDLRWGVSVDIYYGNIRGPDVRFQSRNFQI
jgi:hypothetical protein